MPVTVPISDLVPIPSSCRQCLPLTLPRTTTLRYCMKACMRQGMNQGLSALHRPGSVPEEYAYEELVAELGAAMLCAYTGIDGDLRHSGYIESWLKALRNDKKFILSASGKAQAAMDYLTASKQVEVEQDEVLAA
jgi:antirestriction protein ArdC